MAKGSSAVKKPPSPDRVSKLVATKLSVFTKAERKAIMKSALGMLRLAEKLNAHK